MRWGRMLAAWRERVSTLPAAGSEASPRPARPSTDLVSFPQRSPDEVAPEVLGAMFWQVHAESDFVDLSDSVTRVLAEVKL
jgi:hypothetical protein